MIYHLIASPSVFISYSSADKAIAQRVCALFENRAISCWIAPRNVPPGMDYGEAIMAGIKNSRVVLVLLSEESGASRYVAREVERAVSYEVTVLPVRLVEMRMPERLEFFLGSCQWFDVFPAPNDKRLNELGDAVDRLLGAPVAVALDAASSKSGPVLAGVRPRMWRVGACVAAVAVAFCGVWGLTHRTRSELQSQGGGKHQNVSLTSPKDGASCLGTTQLEWSRAGLIVNELDGFEIEISAAGEKPLLERIGVRYSYSLKQTSGEITWRVRPIYKGAEVIPWSDSWKLTRDQDVLSRIYRTKELHLGHAESGNSFVNGDRENLSGFDIELAKELVTRILKKHDPTASLQFVPHAFSWVEDDNDGDGKPEHFTNRLRRESAIDFLASGVSITDKRKQEGLAFSDPVLRYPQTIIMLQGSSPFAAGKPAFQHLGTVEGTTNASLAQQIKEAMPDFEIVSFKGSGAHEKMLTALFETREIDACIADKPLALTKIENFGGGGTRAEFSTQDVREIAGKPVAPENIGFVIRPGDMALREALNREIAASGEFRCALVRKYFPMLNPATEVP